MNEKRAEISVNGIDETYIFDKVAKHANGAVMYRQGKAVIIATVVLDEKAADEPFLPLTVQYIEKAYAAAKIPAGFIKREGKPGDFETLTSRVVDRSLRPLFPDGFRYPVTITIMVVSVDREIDLQLAALHAANAALLVSDIPVKRSVAAVRVGRFDTEFRLNPDRSEMQKSTLDLFVAGSGKDLLMIEMASRATEKIDDIEMEEMDLELAMGPMPLVLTRQESNEMSEMELMDAIHIASAAIEKASHAFEESILPLKKTQLNLDLHCFEPDDSLMIFIEENFGERIRESLHSLSKSERGSMLKDIVHSAIEKAEEYSLPHEEEDIKRVVEELKRRYVRSQILEERTRADGRRLDEVRKIEIETNILPSVHGSCLFSRGETQVLATATIGGPKDGQLFELLCDRSPQNEKFMLHYNFPAFSVGETKPVSAPGRRELGHGNLAKRALEPVLDMEMENTLRVVSEVLESNGSSSMATVCGACLALCCAEIDVKELVAGVAMGLVVEDEKYAILTDIMGLEDHDGDMDFKVAGTKNGITAMQMDIKLGGLDMKILQEALLQAREARLHILGIMERARREIEPSQALPSIEHFSVDPSKIVHIIGKAGSTIKEIIERFEVAIDLDRDKGKVKVTGHDREKVNQARKHIEDITRVPERAVKLEIGKKYRGKIKRIMDYGIFVELPDGNDALLHISKISTKRIDRLEEIYTEGEEIDVVVLSQNGRKTELATPEYLESRS